MANFSIASKLIIQSNTPWIRQIFKTLGSLASFCALKTEKKEKRKDNQYKLNKAMAIAIGLMSALLSHKVQMKMLAQTGSSDSTLYAGLYFLLQMTFLCI